MYSMHRLPPHWQKWLDNYWIDRNSKNLMNISSFAGVVTLAFPDASHITFQFAFYAVDKERQEIAVFTEHCGYHVFPLEELQYGHYLWASSPGAPHDHDEWVESVGGYTDPIEGEE